MKNILWAVLFFPCIALAEVPITEGNIKQESCGFPDAIRAHSWNIGTYSLPPEVTVKNKLMPVGKVISVGDAIFYANIVSNLKRVSYLAESNIEVIGKSMLASDIAIPKGARLHTRGIIRGQGLGKGYLLVGREDTDHWRSYVAIKDDGYLCSVEVSIDTRDNALLVQDATAYQNTPLVRHEERIPEFDESIALTLDRLDAVSADIGIKVLRAGKVIKQKEIQLDAISGSFELDGLKIMFERAGKSSIRINSISEPNDYYNWHSHIASKLM